MGIYESLGVTPIINATGTWTRLGGSLMPPEVVEAMAQASREFVCLEELQFQAGKAIAEMVGAQAAYVVSGCYAGVVLSIAACIAGSDPAKMNALPHTEGMKHDVVMLKMQRNSYDHAVEIAGGHIVEAGTEKVCTIPHLMAAVTDNTAAIFFLPDWPGCDLTITRVMAAARVLGVPVVVDAAGRLDEPAHLKKYAAEKPDLMCFSGGKHIRGPQASGFVVGRPELISAIAWQHLDMDFVPEVWTAPRELLPVESLPFVPRQGVGRGFKAGKEEILGLVTALRLFLNRDYAAERARMLRQAEAIAQGLRDNPFVQVMIVGGAGGAKTENSDPANSPDSPIPLVRIAIDEQRLEMTAYEFILALKKGSPPIHPFERELPKGAIVINTFSLKPGEEQTIVRRVSEVVAAARPA